MLAHRITCITQSTKNKTLRAVAGAGVITVRKYFLFLMAGAAHSCYLSVYFEQVANLLVLGPTQPPTLSGTGNE